MIILSSRTLFSSPNVPHDILDPWDLSSSLNLVPKPQFLPKPSFSLSLTTFRLKQHLHMNKHANRVRAQVHDLTQVNPHNTSHEYVMQQYQITMLSQAYSGTCISNYAIIQITLQCQFHIKPFFHHMISHFHIYNLRSFECHDFKVFFHL